MDWKKFFRRSPLRGNAQSLYERAVAQARQPAFYEDLKVPDTVDGRFDMVILHVFLLLNRLSGHGKPAKDMGQAIFDVMIVSMDEALREMGVGDLSVGKKIKKMAKAFYGRIAAYQTALESEKTADLAESVRRNLYRGEDVDGVEIEIAQYIRHQIDVLSDQPLERLLLGLVDFAPVEDCKRSQAA